MCGRIALCDLRQVVPGRILAPHWILRRYHSGIHIRPIRFNARKGHPRTLYACRPSHDVNPGHDHKELLHQTKVAIRLRPLLPKMVYYRPHCKSGQPVELRHSSHLLIQRQRASGGMELRPEKLLHFFITLTLEELDSVSCTSRQVLICVCRTLAPSQGSILQIQELRPQ